MITITGWGAFWLGLFGFLALDQLFDLLGEMVQCYTLNKVTKHLSKIDPKTVKEFLKDG